MPEHNDGKQTTIKRIGGYLHRVVPIVDKSGEILSYALKPIMVEFKPRDVFQVIVGAMLFAMPLAFTEEVWNLGEDLPMKNVTTLSLLALFLIGVFVYFNFYRYSLKGHYFQFFLRVFSICFLTIAIVATTLTIIQKCPWSTDMTLAIKRVLLVSVPAAMSATLSDTIK